MKKLVTVAAAAIATLGFTSAIFAEIFSEDESIASAVSFSDAGFYLGIEGGYGRTNWRNLDGASGIVNISGPGTLTTILSAGTDSGAVGRICAGFDINRYFAGEVGYSFYSNTAQVTDRSNAYNYANLKTQNIDMLLKGKIPVDDEFGFFAKIGAAYLITNYTNNGSFISASANNNNLCLAYGAGAEYYVNPNFIAGFEWLRNSGNQKVASPYYAPQTDAIMISLKYRFDL